MCCRWVINQKFEFEKKIAISYYVCSSLIFAEYSQETGLMYFVYRLKHGDAQIYFAFMNFVNRPVFHQKGTTVNRSDKWP